MPNLKTVFTTITTILRYLSDHFKGILLAMLILYLILPSGEVTRPANLVQIDLVGEIHDPHALLEKIEQAQRDESIRGVLLVVNSPGGAVAPSIEIAHAIKRLTAYKPVIAYAQGSMASGSYYASIWATHIYANPGALIGSIGVIFQGMNLEKIMGKVGITSQIAKVGSYKEIGTPTRKWHSYEKAELEKVLLEIYTLFITDVAQARKLNVKNHESFADAHIFTALSAQKVGLIDEVATIHEAKQVLVALSGVKEAVWQKPSLIEKFGERMSSEVISTIRTKLFEPVLK